MKKSMTRHPGIRVSLETANPYALVAAIREEFRRARVDREVIQRFSDEALSQEDPPEIRRICKEWVTLD